MNIKELQDLRNKLHQAYELKKMLIRGYHPAAGDEELQSHFIALATEQIDQLRSKVDIILQQK